MDRLRNYFNKPWNPTVMDDATPLTAAVHWHLRMVYWTLFATAVLLTTGAYTHLIYGIGGFITTNVFHSSINCLSVTELSQQRLRIVHLLTAAYSFGASIGPLINFIVVVDQSDIVKVFVGASLYFACYLVSVAYGEQRDVIYEIAEFWSAILVPTWMVLSPNFPEPIPWYIVGILHFLWGSAVYIHGLFRPKFMIWFDVSIQVAWFCFLRYYFTFSLCDLGGEDPWRTTTLEGTREPL